MSGRGRGRGRAPPTGGRLYLMRSAEECGFDSRNLRSLQDITRPQLFPDILLHSSGDNKFLRLMEEQEQQQQQQQHQQIKHEQQLDQQQNNNSNVKIEADEHNTVSTTPVSNTIVLPQNKLSGMKRSSQRLYLITKGREIHHRIQNSAFHFKATKDVPDVIRHSMSTMPPPSLDASTVLSYCLSGRKRTAMGKFIPEELVSGQRLGGLSGAMISGIDASVAAGRAVSLTDIEARDLARPRLGSTDINAEGGGGGVDEEEYEEPESEDDGEDYVADYYASEDEESDGDNEPTF